MAEDALGFRFLDLDEMVFKNDEDDVRDASMHLLGEVMFKNEAQDKGAPVGEAKVIVADEPAGPDMSFAEGGDFLLF